MCGLFGMSARKPCPADAYLEALGARDGGLGPHADGSGIARYEGGGASVFKEPEPAALSRCFSCSPRRSRGLERL